MAGAAGSREGGGSTNPFLPVLTVPQPSGRGTNPFLPPLAHDIGNDGGPDREDIPVGHYRRPGDEVIEDNSVPLANVTGAHVVAVADGDVRPLDSVARGTARPAGPPPPLPPPRRMVTRSMATFKPGV